MESENIKLSLEEARYMYKNGDETIRNIALKIYGEELFRFDFRAIKSVMDACEVLGIDYDNLMAETCMIDNKSKATAAMYKLNIVRKALHYEYNLCLTKNPTNSCIYYPNIPFTTEDSTYYGELDLGTMETIGKIESEGILYNVLVGDAIIGSGCAGFGDFGSYYGVGDATASVGFLGCASKEIAEHFGKYFGMLITEAKYADIISDFEIIEDKYDNC